MRPALVIFSKVPLPGRTKTRLQGQMSPEECALFHRACLFDLHLLAEQTKMKTFLYFTGGCWPDFYGEFPGPVPAGFEELRRLRLNGLEFRQQQGGDLGERLHHAANQVLWQFEKVLLIGSDLPDLTPKLLLAAGGQLEEHDLVIGRAADQGYYLLGLKKTHPELFQGIDWGTGRVWSQTLLAALRANLDVAYLPQKCDIDTWDDLVDYVHRGRVHRGLRGKLSYRLAVWLAREKSKQHPGDDYDCRQPKNYR